MGIRGIIVKGFCCVPSLPSEAAHQKTKPTVGGFLPEAPKPGGFRTEEKVSWWSLGPWVRQLHNIWLVVSNIFMFHNNP